MTVLSDGLPGELLRRWSDDRHRRPLRQPARPRSGPRARSEIDATGFAADPQLWAPDHHCRYGGARLTAKRLIDVAVAGSLLVVTAPLLGAVTAAVRLTSPGPAIYRQVRIGRSGVPFTMYKFRTMEADAEERLRGDTDLRARYVTGGFKLSLADDPRITRIGAVLRKTSLDELPQLLNVVRGEMSLVGPRPVVPEELDEYGPYLPAYLMAVPGLTGAWQVSGRDAVRFPGRARLDAGYLEGWSLRRDLRILARTIPAAVTGRGMA